MGNETITVAGRITAVRSHGKTTFIDLFDDETRLQCYLKRDNLGERYDFFTTYIERGDFLGVSGTLFVTKMGELTINVDEFQLLSKTLYDLPDEWYGLQRVETRYRQRHLDLLMNRDVRETFRTRNRIIKSVRRVLDEREFVEVETPLIQESYGGASAKPFTTHVNSLGETRYLQISPELYLKRLIVGGMNRVYTVCKNFRNEDIDVTHNPEFTMMECYQAYSDYHNMMDLTETLVTKSASEDWGGLSNSFGDIEIDLSPPWSKITMYEALRKYADINVEQMNDESIIEELRRHDPAGFNRLMDRGGFNRGLFIAQLFDVHCQHHLLQPTFVIDYPKETVPLCKQHRENPELIERFELFINGMEMANAYTELNDPILQEKLFTQETERANQGADETHPNDMNYVEALRSGMPPTGGLGLGIDRLVMLITGNTSIKEVILFPMMKRV